MEAIWASRAKARLAESLRSVEREETVAVTRLGQALAHAIPVAQADRKSRERAVAESRRRRSERQPAGMSVEEALDARRLVRRA